MATTNMTLILPTVSATLGPLWASELNTALTLVDSHDHTTGKGVKVTPAGLNINADLPMASNDLTTVRTVAFDSQAAALSASDIRAVYSVLGDLYWNNGSGTAVQITSGASVQSSASTIARAFERLAVNANKTILAGDTYSYLDTDTGSSVIYTLPAANAVAAGRFYEFHDSTGQAATNNITINRAGADTIDGATSTVINQNYGSSRLVSDGTSKWLTNLAGIQTQLSSKITSVTTTVFTGSGTWTKATINPKFVRVICVAAGGGGGGSDGTAVSSGVGGGGGGGGTSIRTIMASLLGATETVTVGTGGTAGSNTGGNGGSGGASSFGALVTANPGTGGDGSTTKTAVTLINGGSGGAGLTGDYTISGGSGGWAIITDTGGTDFPCISGVGGSSFLCGAKQAKQPGAAAASAGTAGTNGGGGSGGATRGTVAGAAGGAGGNGIVIVEEYF